MKHTSLLLIVLLFEVTFADKYIITRRVRNGEIQPDLVQIPPSLCANNGTTECPSMDGERHSICQCICSKKDDLFRLYKTTFQIYNNTWKCVKNAALHQLSGCTYSLDSAEENVLASLPSNATTSYTLTNATTESNISLRNGTVCAVSVGNSAYLNCYSQWEQLNSALISKRFRITYKVRSDGKHGIYVSVISTAHSSYPLPSGRIIRLAVTCSDRPWEPSQCIVAKVQGQLECPAPTRPSSTSSTSSSSSSKPNTTAVPAVDKTNGGSGKIPYGTLIGVLMGGIVALVALVITIVIIANRRTKRSGDARKNSSAAMVVENESFEQGNDLRKEYHHPYENVIPGVVPSKSASVLNNNGKRKTNVGEHRNSVSNKVYEVVEELDSVQPKPNTGNMTVQQDPTKRTRKEPLPTIPESPMFISFKDPHHYDSIDINNVRQN